MTHRTFIEIDHYRLQKATMNVSGDVVLSRKVDQGRYVSILCDGLGSGVEANCLASFTASMGIEYMIGDLDIRRTAELIMDALPICPVRKISYSAFSIADIRSDGDVRVIVHGNPPCLIFRGGDIINQIYRNLCRPRWRDRALQYGHFNAAVGDRIVLVSDGVTQSGIGSIDWPMGCGSDTVAKLIRNLLQVDSDVSAGDLSKKVCEVALANDENRAGDDISCVVISFRKPRILRVLTGPPYDRNLDREYSYLLRNWKGRSAVCGGTTANIIERELGITAEVDMSSIDPVIPATSIMPGVDLVTEGCITLSCCARLLESRDLEPRARKNGALALRDLFLGSDIIEFYMGTRVNQAHQDPKLPIELDIRRNLVKKIASLLEKEYLKETSIRYF